MAWRGEGGAGRGAVPSKWGVARAPESVRRAAACAHGGPAQCGAWCAGCSGAGQARTRLCERLGFSALPGAQLPPHLHLQRMRMHTSMAGNGMGAWQGRPGPWRARARAHALARSRSRTPCSPALARPPTAAGPRRAPQPRRPGCRWALQRQRQHRRERQGQQQGRRPRGVQVLGLRPSLLACSLGVRGMRQREWAARTAPPSCRARATCGHIS